MTPSKLYERDNYWFALEWDARDIYLNAALGRLVRFRDVMPRVIVRGPYIYEATGTRGDAEGFLTEHLARVAHDLPDSVAHYQESLPTMAAREREHWERSAAGEAGYERFLDALGAELTLAEWLANSRGAVR